MSTTFEDLISGAWSRHQSNAEDVARELTEGLHLVESTQQASRYAAVAIHVVGGHLGDWAQAAELTEAAVGNGASGDGFHTALGSLAAAQFLAGMGLRALETESRAIEEGDDPISTMTRIRFIVAEGLAHAGQVEACSVVYHGAVTLAESLRDEAAGVRSAAIVSNNIASELLERTDRDSHADHLMMDAALQARTFWARAGTWVNAERAEYLLALVYNAFEDYPDAEKSARAGLQIIVDNEGGEEVDQTFLTLQLARALAGLGKKSDAQSSLSAADKLADGFESDGLKNWFKEERAKVAPFIEG